MQEMYARCDEITSRKQTLKEHLEGVTERMTQYAGAGLGNTAKLLGVLHDCGKFSDVWQGYFLRSLNKDNSSKFASYAKVPHSTQGARFISELHNHYLNSLQDNFSGENRNEEIVFNDLTADLLRYAILAHHGMFDAMTPDGKFSLAERARLTEADEQKVFEECKSKIALEYPDIDFGLAYRNAVREVKNLLLPPPHGQLEFDIGFLARMLLSMLIDADWSDAAAFPSGHTEYESLLKGFKWDNFLGRIEHKSRSFEQINLVDSLRTQISDECVNAAPRKSGIYKLDVPTGGGKTLSAMRFALNHAKMHGKSRIIYVAPFISILEQNAVAYRELLAATEAENRYITNHYTDVVRISSDDADLFDGEADVSRVTKAGTDNWASPIIFTTMVQLLLTITSSKKQSVRRLHNLADSVLIIDEYQALPVKSLSLFNRAVNTLSRYFNATIILCTATQPPFEEMITSNSGKTRVQKINFADEPDLVKDYGSEKAFKRVELIDARINKGKGGAYDMAGLTHFVREKMAALPSLLVILNTRKAVRNLYKELSSGEHLADVKIYMLSNNMCPAHRNEIIERVKKELRAGVRILLVSTSLIEAGVDISFAGVVRTLAGLDVIVQSAGRCNRNGELEKGKVWIVETAADVENISRLKSLRDAQDAMRPLLDDFSENPGKYNDSLMSKVMLKKYFFEYFKIVGDQTCYPLANGTDLNELLAGNRSAVTLYGKKGNQGDMFARVKQSFYTAGKEYKPIEDDSISVLVPYGAGKKIIEDLNSNKFRHGAAMEDRRKILNAAGYFSVNVFSNVFEELKEEGGLFEISWGDRGDIIYAVRDEFYGDHGLGKPEMKEGEKNNASISKSVDIF